MCPILFFEWGWWCGGQSHRKGYNYRCTSKPDFAVLFVGKYHPSIDRLDRWSGYRKEDCRVAILFQCFFSFHNLFWFWQGNANIKRIFALPISFFAIIKEAAIWSKPIAAAGYKIPLGFFMYYHCLTLRKKGFREMASGKYLYGILQPLRIGL